MSFTAAGTPLKRLSEFCNIIYPWGITICFQVIFAKFACQILNDTFGMDLYVEGHRAEEIYNEKGNWVRIIINLAFFTLAMVFALKKDISLLQKIAIVGVVAAVYNIAVVIIVSFTGFTRHNGA